MVRLADIARATGYSLFTVSCALRDRGRLTDETRRRVKEAAARMGYEGNAVASLLAQQKRREPGAQLRLGWIGRDVANLSFAGFQRACAELGYHGDWINSHAFPSPRNMVSVLWNRGYSGVVLSYFRSDWAEKKWMEADWDRLCVVKNLRGFPGLSFHLVRHSAFDYMMFTLDEVWRRGYRRIGLFMAESLSDLDDNARLGATLAFRERIRSAKGSLEFRSLPEYKGGGLDRTTMEWLSAYRPDVIVGFPYVWLNALRESGYAVPQDIAFATPLSSAHLPGAPGACGCDPQVEALEYRAVCLLHTLIQTGTRGMVESSLQDVVVPRWVDCGTLPVVRRKTRAGLARAKAG